MDGSVQLDDEAKSGGIRNHVSVLVGHKHETNADRCKTSDNRQFGEHNKDVARMLMKKATQAGIRVHGVPMEVRVNLLNTSLQIVFMMVVLDSVPALST